MCIEGQLNYCFILLFLAVLSSLKDFDEIQYLRCGLSRPCALFSSIFFALFCYLCNQIRQKDCRIVVTDCFQSMQIYDFDSFKLDQKYYYISLNLISSKIYLVYPHH